MLSNLHGYLLFQHLVLLIRHLNCTVTESNIHVLLSCKVHWSLHVNSKKKKFILKIYRIISLCVSIGPHMPSFVVKSVLGQNY